MRAVKKYNQGGKPLTPFEKAFAEAKRAGKKTFMFDRDGDGVMEEYTTVTEQGQGIAKQMEQAFAKMDRRGSYDERVQAMLDSGAFKLGPQGELIRVPMPSTTGVVSPERLKYLESLDRPLTESEAREYATHAFDPDSNPGRLYSTVSGAALGGMGQAGNVYKGTKGLMPSNIYEQIAGNIGRYGTRDVATKPTVVNRIADYVTDNFPSFLRSQ
tara:strand:- start:4349 stop:4990 length:642 start_codon:yes stop_codon:yes gene_type:complete